MKDESVDAVITDPPYHTNFMGKKWDKGGIAYNVDLWKECLRVLKPGGYLLSFGGTRTYHRMACAIEDAGFEIRDMIEWIYASGFPKSLSIGKGIDKKLGNKREIIKEYKTHDIRGNGLMDKKNSITVFETKGNSGWEGWGTALKPAHEPICMARKPLSEKTICDNILKHGTGGISIDGCRIPGNQKKWENPRAGIWKTDKNKKSKLINNNQGRFPANIVCQDDALEFNCRYFDIDIWAKKNGLFQFPKASKSEKNRGCDGLEEKQKVFNGQSNKSSKEIKDVEERFTTKPSNNPHPTVKPLPLMQYLITLISKPNDTIFDPFAGSGTTLVAAKGLGRQYIGIELTKEYIPIIEARLKIIQKPLL